MEVGGSGGQFGGCPFATWMISSASELLTPISIGVEKI